MHLILSRLPKRPFLTHERCLINLTGNTEGSKKYCLNKGLFLGVCNVVSVKRPKQRVNSVSQSFFVHRSLPRCICFKVYQRFELNPSKRRLDIQGCPSAKRILHSLILPWDEGRNRRALIDLGHL